jgi:hypothetical protein
MNKRLSWFLFRLACVASFAGVPMPAQDDSIYWYSDYREAVRQAKQTQKPIFLEFRCEA